MCGQGVSIGIQICWLICDCADSHSHTENILGRPAGVHLRMKQQCHSRLKQCDMWYPRGSFFPYVAKTVSGLSLEIERRL